MLTAKDSLNHLIDLSNLTDEAKVSLRRLVRRMTTNEAEALDILIQEIADQWINPETGEAALPTVEEVERLED